jgi:hypothetical protein
MPQRKWLPAFYVDEVIPSPRDTMDSWITRVGDAFFIAGLHDDDDLSWRLSNGDIVDFEWTEQDHGHAQVTIEADGTYACSRDVPTIEGGTMHMAEDFNNESVADCLKTFVENWLRDCGDLPAVVDIHFFAWGNETARMEFRDGAFLPAPIGVTDAA